jgi:hypothetical protein
MSKLNWPLLTCFSRVHVSPPPDSTINWLPVPLAFQPAAPMIIKLPLGAVAVVVNALVVLLSVV